MKITPHRSRPSPFSHQGVICSAAQAKSNEQTEDNGELARQTDCGAGDESRSAGQRGGDVYFAAEHNRAFRPKEIPQNAAEGGGDHAHRDGHRRAYPKQQRLLGSDDGKMPLAAALRSPATVARNRATSSSQ